MSFLKNIWRTSSKHKKLSEEWALAKNNRDIDNELSEANDELGENDEAVYKIKYLGSTLVDRAANESATAEAIKTILRVVKAAGKKLPRVTVSVSSKGIKISDTKSGNDNEISIYRISYCSADAAHNRVFAFIAANGNETMECHAFLCSKRKHAQAVTLAVARSFSMAYEAWRVLPTPAHKDKQHQCHDESAHADTHTAAAAAALYQLIDLGDLHEPVPAPVTLARPQHQFNQNEWVSFDDDTEGQRWTNTQQQIDLICS